MSVDIGKLLSLSAGEKRLITETLWDSLLLEDEDDDLGKEEKQLLQQRFDSLENSKK